MNYPGGGDECAATGSGYLLEENGEKRRSKRIRACQLLEKQGSLTCAVLDVK